MNFKEKLLAVCLFILIIINFIVIYTFTLLESRIVRLLGTLLFFIIFLIYKGYKERFISVAFFVFLVSDVFMIFYEKSLYSKLTLITSMISYIVLIYHIFLKIEKTQLKLHLIVIYLFLIGLNFYSLHQILLSIDHLLHDNFQKISLYFYGTIVITVSAIVVGYTGKQGLLKSMFCKFFVFGFCFADLFAVLAYYFDLYYLYYIDRLIYLFSLFFMVNYILVNPENDKKLLIED